MQQKLQQWLWQWRGALITAPAVTVLLIGLRLTGMLQLLEWSALDQFFQLKPIEPTDPNIVIVEIGESDIQYLKRWPISDQVLAQFLQKLKQQQPLAIGLDIYRNLAIEPGSAELDQVFRSTPNLIGIQKVSGDALSSAVPPPPRLKELGQVAANDLVLDADGKIRRNLLYNGELEGFGLRLALIYLESKGITPQAAAIDANYLQLGRAVFPIFQGSDGGYIRANDQGYQTLIHYRGPAYRFRRISLQAVMEDQVPPGLLQNRLVLVGASAPSLNDLFQTPYSSTLLSVPERMAGIEIHANVTSQIIQAATLGRPILQSWSDPLEWLWMFVWAGVGAVWSWNLRLTSGRRSPWQLISLPVLIAGLIGGSYLAFLQGWWLPLVPALLTVSGSALAIITYTARTAGEIRKTFGRYLTDEVVASLLETPGGLKLGGERRKVTILMSDLRGFSAVSERLPPEAVVSFLNIYLGMMAEVITQFQGTIDEFIGDAILVIFGAPTPREDDAQRAVACAIAMQLAMEQVNAQIQHLNMPKLEMGIGINTGEVVVGNIGSTKRSKYGIVGSHVNLTGRIESYTVGGQILISEYTLQDAGPVFRLDGQMQVEPKGIKEPITLYDVGGIQGKYNLSLPQEETAFCQLPQPVPVQFIVLDGKHVVGSLHTGKLRRISATGAELDADCELAPLSNLKINLSTQTFESLEKPASFTAVAVPEAPSDVGGDLYAKVLSVQAATCVIRFTAIPPDVAAVISELVQQYSQSSQSSQT